MSGKRMLWGVCNLGLLLLAWFGLVDGMQGCVHALLFIIGATFVLSVGCLTMGVARKAADDPRFPSVPLWLNVMVDAALCVLLVWYGHWVAATLWALHIINYVTLHDNVQTIRNNRKNLDVLEMLCSRLASTQRDRDEWVQAYFKLRASGAKKGKAKR